jgi:hypothetical protein
MAPAHKPVPAPRDLLDRFRQHHQHGHFPVHGQAIALVGLEGFFIADDVVRVDERPELLRKLHLADFGLGSHNSLWLSESSGPLKASGQLAGQMARPVT